MSIECCTGWRAHFQWHRKHYTKARLGARMYLSPARWQYWAFHFKTSLWLLWIHVHSLERQWICLYKSGDTSAAAPLHSFHLRRLRLALQVRSHHASMLPWHHSAAKRDQTLPLLHRSFSTGNFHWIPVFFHVSPNFTPPCVTLIPPPAPLWCADATVGQV